MLTCPMCKKKLRGLEKACLNCKADVSLLVDYVGNLQEGLTRAEERTRAGKLGEAVWAYLEVLEVDPDNTTARKQVGSVVTAVRQFDETAPGRRYLTKLHKKKRFRRWMANASDSGEAAGWLSTALIFVVVVGALVVGYMMGVQSANPGESSPSTTPSKRDRDKDIDKKPAEGLGKPGG